METHLQFPTYYDIYSIYISKSFKKLRKNKIAFIPKLLETLLDTYPDLKRFVAQKSLDSEYLQKLLTTILYKMNKVKKRPHLSSRKELFQISLVSNFSLCGPLDSGEVDQGSATTFQDCEPSLREQPPCNGSDTRTFCVANVWAGFPTFGSIYSTSKLDVVQQLKGDNEEFITVMLKILMKKYPRLKTVISDLSLSNYCITETLLYILKQAERFEQSSCKQEKRQFFSTVFNIEILSNISKQGIQNEKTDGKHSIKEDIKNGSAISDIDRSVKELSANCTMHDSSSVCVNKKSIDQFHLEPRCKAATPDITSENNVGNKTYLYEYLKKLKSKYAWTRNELAEKSNLEINLERKLKNLLTKQRKYKYKIKRCRKEMTEFDSFKSICRR